MLTSWRQAFYPGLLFSLVRQNRNADTEVSQLQPGVWPCHRIWENLSMETTEVPEWPCKTGLSYHTLSLLGGREIHFFFENSYNSRCFVIAPYPIQWITNALYVFFPHWSLKQPVGMGIIISMLMFKKPGYMTIKSSAYI